MVLPVVKKETVNSVLRDIETKDLYKRIWTEMCHDNEELFRTICSAIKQSDDKVMSESFLRGAFLVWSLLRSQDEADRMNEEWGI